jgi:hypothetical protein
MVSLARLFHSGAAEAYRLIENRAMQMDQALKLELLTDGFLMSSRLSHTNMDHDGL